MDENEFRTGQSVDEQLATEAESPKQNADAGVAAQKASASEIPDVTNATPSVSERINALKSQVYDNIVMQERHQAEIQQYANQNQQLNQQIVELSRG